MPLKKQGTPNKIKVLTDAEAKKVIVKALAKDFKINTPKK